jgi:acetolactate synthase regulatory subunit
VSGQRFAFIALQKPIASQRIAFAADQGLERIASQVVMIIEIFVAQYQSVNPLSDQLHHPVFDIALVSIVDEAIGKIL